MEQKILILCPMKVRQNNNGKYVCVGRECAWYDNDKCAVVALVEQVWFLRKDVQ